MDVTSTARKSVLFVGAIDGGVEMEFLTMLGDNACDVYITSYLAGPDLPKATTGSETTHSIIPIEGIDGTNLASSFPEMRFDAIAGLGPTNDDDKGQTAALVQRFTQSAAEVLKPQGAVYVLQDLKTPNFRDIIKIPGAHFLCQVSLEGRTMTQTSTSTSKKVMKGRKDHLFEFLFDDSASPRDVNNEGNAEFEQILTMIMSSKDDKLKKGSYKDGKGAHSKKEIADIIFQYADNTT
ncbi:MAG: hypothetical protein AAGD13_20915 [Pseudomonadota bacterium]